MNISSRAQHTCTHSSPYFLCFKTETLVSLKNIPKPVKGAIIHTDTHVLEQKKRPAHTTEMNWVRVFHSLYQTPANTMTCDHLPMITPLWPNCYLMPKIAFVTVLEFTGCMPFKGVFDIALHCDTGIPWRCTGISTFVRIDNTRSPALKA